jgi:nitrile hydratase accessory protein
MGNCCLANFGRLAPLGWRSPSLKIGHSEWEEFRQELITAIAQWEAAHCKDDPTWDYYQRWLTALECLAVESGIIDSAELEQRTQALLDND